MQHLDVFIGDHLVHVLLVPVRRVRERKLGPPVMPGLLELADRRFEHRIKAREVGRAVGDFCGDHDLALIHDRLRVISLHKSVVGFHRWVSGSVTLTTPSGTSGRDPLLRSATEPPALRVTTVLAVILIRPVGRDLRVTLGLEALAREQEPILARARNGIRAAPSGAARAGGALPASNPGVPVARHDPLGVELELRPPQAVPARVQLQLLIVGCLGRAPLARLTEELGPSFPRAQLLGQLIPALLAIQLVLGLIGRLSLGQNLPRDLLKIARRLAARVPRHPRPIDRDHPRPDQTSLIAQPQHLREQPV